MSNDEMTVERFIKEMREYELTRGAKDLVSPNVIPTMYKGINFRSRLEARWAVFFDTLGIEWEYEPQGYEVGMSYYVDPENPEMFYTYSDGSTLAGEWQKNLKEAEGITVVAERPATGKEDLEWYLPDFWLPELKIWAEVKGVFGDSELLTTVRSIDGFSMGLPNIKDFDKENPTGLLYLGDIPNPDRNRGSGSHIMFTRRKGVENRVARFRFNHKLERVELEVGATYDDWWYLDITCMNEETVKSYSEENNYKRIVKGLPRNYEERAISMSSVSRSLHSQASSMWYSDKYLPIQVDEFGEKVIEAGWLEARNYQF